MRKRNKAVAALLFLILSVSLIPAHVLAASEPTWHVAAPTLRKNMDVLVLNLDINHIRLPETIPATFTPLDGENQLAESKTVEVSYTLDEGFLPDLPGEYDVPATIVVPDEYTLSDTIRSTLKFNFWIIVTSSEPDLAIVPHQPGSVLASTDCSPEKWDLPDAIRCTLKCRNFSQPDQDLGMLPVAWDLNNIAKNRPDKNGEYEATVRGDIILPEELEIEGVDGVSENRTMTVEIEVLVRNSQRPFGFARPTKHYANPRYLYNNKPFVRFYLNFFHAGWGDDLRVWLTEDDGRTFRDVKDSDNIKIDENEGSPSINLYDLEYGKWYGICLELKGHDSYTAMSETIYFMFTEEDMNTDPSTGDRGGDGRWAFGGNKDTKEEPSEAYRAPVNSEEPESVVAEEKQCTEKEQTQPPEEIAQNSDLDRSDAEVVLANIGGGGHGGPPGNNTAQGAVNNDNHWIVIISVGAVLLFWFTVIYFQRRKRTAKRMGAL